MTIQEVKDRVPLDAELGRRGVKLIPNGKNKFMCCCPIHRDSNPSCSVDLEKGLWNCFGGCGGGSVIDLVMRLDGLSFKDAFVKLGGDNAREETQWTPPEPSAPPKVNGSIFTATFPPARSRPA